MLCSTPLLYPLTVFLHIFYYFPIFFYHNFPLILCIRCTNGIKHDKLALHNKNILTKFLFSKETLIMPLTLNELYTQTKQQYHLSMIAGEAGIDHIMNWVYVSEDSSTHDFLKGGELIITTGINCQDEASLYDFIETMIKSHTCGMILNTGKYILSEDITDSIKALCDKHNYPLIEMPWKVHIYAITRDYYNKIFMDTQKDTSITDAFLSFIEEDSLHHYDALRILEDNHFEKEDCYEIALMKCNKKAISDDLKLRLLFLMESYIKLNDLDIHIAFYKNHFLFVFHDMEEELIYNEISSLISTLENSFKKMQIYAGIGSSVHTLREIRVSYQRSLAALVYAANNGQEIARFEEMGFFRILHSVNDKNLLMAYHDEYLKNIEEYDEIHDTNYLETLHQYLLCNGSIQHVASNMFCHRNTITYRMRVIEDHWDLKLDDTVERFHLMTAFFIRDYLNL